MLVHATAELDLVAGLCLGGRGSEDEQIDITLAGGSYGEERSDTTWLSLGFVQGQQATVSRSRNRQAPGPQGP